MASNHQDVDLEEGPPSDAGLPPTFSSTSNTAVERRDIEEGGPGFSTLVVYKYRSGLPGAFSLG